MNNPIMFLDRDNKIKLVPASFSYFFELLCEKNKFHVHSQTTGQQGKEEAIYLTPVYYFHRLHRHVYISRAIIAENSSLHIVSSRSRNANLWLSSPSASRYSLCYASLKCVIVITVIISPHYKKTN